MTIKDDEEWEPDEDFYVQLYSVHDDKPLPNKDVRTRVTIIDDDKPGQICFQEPKIVTVLATDEVAQVVIDRKNGADGTVFVDYVTLELDSSVHSATAGKEYKHTEGTLELGSGEIEGTIEIPII